MAVFQPAENKISAGLSRITNDHHEGLLLDLFASWMHTGKGSMVIRPLGQIKSTGATELSQIPSSGTWRKKIFINYSFYEV
jgi:hypothetical protein